MTAGAGRLTDSAFLADLDERDESLWRFGATLGGGLAAGVLAGLIVGAAILVVFVLVSGAAHGGVVSFAARVTTLISSDGSTLTSVLLILVLAAATNCPLAAAFIVIAALVQRRRIIDYLTVAPRFRWRLLACGLVLSMLLIGPVVLLGEAGDKTAARPPILALTSSFGGRALYAFLCVSLLIPAAAAEEVVFRGWLLKQSAALLPRPTRALSAARLVTLNGVAFSAVHGDFVALLGSVAARLVAGLAMVKFLRKRGWPPGLDLTVTISSLLVGAYVLIPLVGLHGDLESFVTRAAMGAGFAYMTLRLGGIELAIGAHAANNILIVLFIQPLSLKPQPPQPLGMRSALEDLFLIVGYVALTEAVARWASLRRLAGVEPAELQRGAGSPVP